MQLFSQKQLVDNVFIALFKAFGRNYSLSIGVSAIVSQCEISQETDDPAHLEDLREMLQYAREQWVERGQVVTPEDNAKIEDFLRTSALPTAPIGSELERMTMQSLAAVMQGKDALDEVAGHVVNKDYFEACKEGAQDLLCGTRGLQAITEDLTHFH